MKTQIILIIFALATLTHTYTQGQTEHQNRRHDNTNVRIARPFGISANIGGGNILGLSLDYFPVPQLSLEAGVGFSQYFAVKYHFLGGKDELKWSPFIGAAYCIPSFLKDNEYGEVSGFFAFPVGVHFIGRTGFSFSIAVAAVLYQNEFWGSTVIPWGGIRIGYHF